MKTTKACSTISYNSLDFLKDKLDQLVQRRYISFYAFVKHYAEDLGYEYMSASNKDEFAKVVSRFVSSEKFEKPFLFEVFTETKDESDALEMILNMVVDKQAEMVSKMKNVVRGVVGAKGVEVIKKILK